MCFEAELRTLLSSCKPAPGLFETLLGSQDFLLEAETLSAAGESEEDEEEKDEEEDSDDATLVMTTQEAENALADISLEEKDEDEVGLMFGQKKTVTDSQDLEKWVSTQQELKRRMKKRKQMSSIAPKKTKKKQKTKKNEEQEEEEEEEEEEAIALGSSEETSESVSGTAVLKSSVDEDEEEKEDEEVLLLPKRKKQRTSQKSLGAFVSGLTPKMATAFQDLFGTGNLLGAVDKKKQKKQITTRTKKILQKKIVRSKKKASLKRKRGFGAVQVPPPVTREIVSRRHKKIKAGLKEGEKAPSKKTVARRLLLKRQRARRELSSQVRKRGKISGNLHSLFNFFDLQTLNLKFI